MQMVSRYSWSVLSRTRSERAASWCQIGCVGDGFERLLRFAVCRSRWADARAVLYSNDDGEFHFKAIVLVPYPIPDDGPVGKLLKSLKRHPYRPSHMHFMFEKADMTHW